MNELSKWLASTRLSTAFASAEWFVPAVQTVHILGIAVVVSTVVILSVRLFQPATSGPDLARMRTGALRATWWALLILLITGGLLTMAEPDRELMSPVFQLKMLLVAALCLLLHVVQRPLRLAPEHWAGERQRKRAMLLGASALACVLAIVWAGRFIAYMGKDGGFL